MRWVRFQHAGIIRYGSISGELVQPVREGPFGDTTRVGDALRLQDVQLLPPVLPRNFYAVGYNYIDHTVEAASFLTKAPKTPDRPEVGYRSVSALIGHEQPVVIPAGSSGTVQFEGELVVVIGRQAKHVRFEDALDVVLGYTIGNDISERSWQAVDRTIWRSKNADTFKPMGPWIETDVSLDDLVTTIHLNGRQVSQFKTNNMIFGVEAYIVEITKFVTLYPGDVLWMGAQAPCLDMCAGDVVEVEINGIGTLTNPVTGEI
jgi:2-keto-4-pentenoate hydratase/2-oxohepta-3-ene-1,7-dioic acid hydratase in catechol pathway